MLSVWPRPTGAAPAPPAIPRLDAPIVLAHGLFGFRRIGLGPLTLETQRGNCRERVCCVCVAGVCVQLVCASLFFRKESLASAAAIDVSVPRTM